MIRPGLLFLLTAFSLTLQAQLKPSIGLSGLPDDSKAICTISTYNGGYSNSGFSKDSTVRDFTLYDVKGQSMNLSTELSKGKPILLVAGSYTCPVFRNKLATINKIVTDYGSQLSVWLVYVVEAHPITDPSPYSGKEWVTGQNQQDGILYRQPTTYGERKAIASDQGKNMSITPPMLIDGPCNEWWLNFGPAPNNSYIILPNGKVFSKHGWFDKSPDDIFCDIDKLLGTTCDNQQTGGTFTWKLNGSNTVSGGAGEVLSVSGKLINNSSASAEIEIIRMQNVAVSGWASAMCVDVCLQEWVDTTEFVLAAGDSQSYTMYFYSGSAGNESAHARIGFRNKAKSSNKMSQDFYGNTWMSYLTDVQETSLKLYPNPASDHVTIIAEMKTGIYLSNVHGNVVSEAMLDIGFNKINLSDLAEGLYFLVNGNTGHVIDKIIIQRR